MRDDVDEWDDPSCGDEDTDDYGDDAVDEPTRDCPYCGVEMLEICVQCPSCGQYLSQEDSHVRSQPLWVYLTAILCLAAILFWMLAV